MQNAIARMIKKISRLPLFNRLRYKFSGYKTQVFFDSVCKKAPKYILVISIVLIIGYMFLHPRGSNATEGSCAAYKLVGVGAYDDPFLWKK